MFTSWIETLFLEGAIMNWWYIDVLNIDSISILILLADTSYYVSHMDVYDKHHSWLCSLVGRVLDCLLMGFKFKTRIKHVLHCEFAS